MAAQITVAVFGTSLIATFRDSSAALNNKGLWAVVTGAPPGPASSLDHTLEDMILPIAPL